MDLHPVGLVNPALLFGLAFDLILFGVLTAQVYVYHISFPSDWTLLKVAVGWVYLAGVAQTGLALWDFNMSFLKALVFLKTNTLDFEGDHFWLSITALTGAVAVVIQSLYAHRIYLISRKHWLRTMIACMSLGQLASSIIGAVCFRREEAVSAFISILPSVWKSPSVCNVGFTVIWGPTNVACDLTITICMVTFLRKHRKRTLSRQTRSRITSIVQIVIETGMATTVCVIIYTILFIFWTDTHDFKGLDYFPLPGLMMSKVYSNSMLVLLNNRATISGGRNVVESFEFIEVLARDHEGDIELRN